MSETKSAESVASLVERLNAELAFAQSQVELFETLLRNTGFLAESEKEALARWQQTEKVLREAASRLTEGTRRDIPGPAAERLKVTSAQCESLYPGAEHPRCKLPEGHSQNHLADGDHAIYQWPRVSAAERPAQTCATCKWWIPRSTRERKPDRIGMCQMAEGRTIVLQLVGDPDHVGLMTQASFGCTLHESAAPRSVVAPEKE